jgi:phosphatidylglycerophosphate synthase
VDVLLILSGVLVVAFFALVAARDFVIDHVTSRSLGSLAPGYAATRRGYYTYAALVGVIGLILLALYIGNPWLVLLWISLFLATSIAAIAGEVRTYRELKR